MWSMSFLGDIFIQGTPSAVGLVDKLIHKEVGSSALHLQSLMFNYMCHLGLFHLKTPRGRNGKKSGSCGCLPTFDFFPKHPLTHFYRPPRHISYGTPIPIPTRSWHPRATPTWTWHPGANSHEGSKCSWVDLRGCQLQMSALRGGQLQHGHPHHIFISPQKRFFYIRSYHI